MTVATRLFLENHVTPVGAPSKYKSYVSYCSKLTELAVRPKTVMVHSPSTPPKLDTAVIVQVPGPTAVAFPFSSILTTEVSLDTHVKDSVVFLGVTRAVNVLLSPFTIVVSVVFTLIFVIGCAGVTIKVQTANKPLPSVIDTLIFASPSFTAVTIPEASTFATEASLEDHSTF